MSATGAGERVTVVHLTSVHSVHDTRVLYRECHSLASAGYDVVLIAPHERDETLCGVGVRSVHRQNGRVKRLLLSTWAVLRRALATPAAVYHFHDPELILVGCALRLMGHRVIYDVHEDVPLQVLSKFWIPRPFRRLISAFVRCLEWAAAQIFDGIVAATPTIAARFPEQRTIVIQNFPDVRELASTQQRPYAERERVFAYIGAISEIRGAREMIGAMHELKDPSIQLVCLGHFQPAALEQELRLLANDAGVMLPGRGGRDAVNALLSHARAGLVVLHPTPNYLDSYPVKLFEYMSAGLPVIASDFPLWRRIIEDSCCGLLVDPRDPSAIARAMTWLLEHPDEAENMGQSGLRAVLSKYNWADQSRRLLAMYARLTAYDHKSLRGRSATVNTAAYIAGDVETHSRQV